MTPNSLSNSVRITIKVDDSECLIKEIKIILSKAEVIKEQAVVQNTLKDPLDQNSSIKLVQVATNRSSKSSLDNRTKTKIVTEVVTRKIINKGEDLKADHESTVTSLATKLQEVSIDQSNEVCKFEVWFIVLNSIYSFYSINF